MLTLAILGGAQEQTLSVLEPEAMVRKALGEQERVAKVLEDYSYTKHVVAETTDMKGKQLSRHERVYEFSACGSKTCVKLVSSNGAAPTPKELKEHDKEQRKLWEREAKKSAADKQKEQDDDLFLSSDFLKVYSFTLAGRESYREQPAHVLEFTPKAGKVQLKDDDNKILTKMAGRLWVAEKDGKILASEMHAIKSIKVWGGFAGAINTMKVRIDYHPTRRVCISPAGCRMT